MLHQKNHVPQNPLQSAEQGVRGVLMIEQGVWGSEWGMLRITTGSTPPHGCLINSNITEYDHPPLRGFEVLPPCTMI